MDRPFTEEEKRQVLAEAIRNSTIPLERIFAMVNEHNVVPAWELMLLPHGRNVKQCKDAFESLRPIPATNVYQSQYQHQPQYQYHGPDHSLPIPATSSKRKSAPGAGSLEPFISGPAPKRRQSSADPVIIARDIRPKPPSTGSPLSTTSFPNTEPKKRGRPSKKDVERKQNEAVARGEIIPPAPSMSMLGSTFHGEEANMGSYAPIRPTPTPSPAYMYAPSPTGPTPVEQGPSALAADYSERKKRPKVPPKSLKVAPRQPGESSFSVYPTISQLLEPEEPQASSPVAIAAHLPAKGPPVAIVTTHHTLPSIMAEAQPTTHPPPTTQPPTMHAPSTIT